MENKFEKITEMIPSKDEVSNVMGCFKVYYQDGIPCGGQNVADYNAETGE